MASALALAACSVGEGGEGGATTFGTFGMTSTPTTMSSSASSGSATEVEDDDSSATSDSASSGEADTTSETSSVASSGSADPTSGSATSAGSEQPEDGMYSACESAVDCVGLTSCEQGFCTSTCMDTSVCDAAPGGTAQPTCFMFDTGMKCALSCTGGETCPTPMQCQALATGSVCAS